MNARLRLVPLEADLPKDRLELRLGNALEAIFLAHGFTATQQAVALELELLAKANRSRLAQQGWIA